MMGQTLRGKLVSMCACCLWKINLPHSLTKSSQVCIISSLSCGVCLSVWAFPSIRPVIHPFNFLIPEEEDDGRGGGRRKRQQQIKNFKLKKKKTSY